MVDDNKAFLQAARYVLEREGIVVAGLASTSAEALRVVDELRPDVTLVDVVLGHECGFDLAQQLDAMRFTDPMTVILMSTRAEEDVVPVIGAGSATAFLTKIDMSAKAIREIHRRSPR